VAHPQRVNTPVLHFALRSNNPLPISCARTGDPLHSFLHRFCSTRWFLLTTGQLHLTTYMTCSQYHVLQIPIFCVFQLRFYLILQTIKSTFGPLCFCTDRLLYFTAEFKVVSKDPSMEVLLTSDLLARGFDGVIVRLSAIYTIPGIQTHFRK
jgi:hypothetical protein